MRWPWQNPTADNAWRVGIENKLAVLEHHVRSGQETMAERLELLAQLPRMARQVAKTSAIVGEWQEHREAEREDRRRLHETLDATAQYLMRWVDELSAIGQQADAGDAWQGVHGAWLRQAEAALTEMGFTEIPVLGRAFDATVAEAVGAVEFTGAAAPYTVVEVVRRGYVFEGQLWRRAAVITVREDVIEEER